MVVDNSREVIPSSINAGRREDRDLMEMLGLVKGVLADGKVCEAEANHLNTWIRCHPDVLATFPGKALADRLTHIFEDGRVDVDERRDLAQLLKQLVGGEAGLIGGESSSTELPLDSPPPPVQFSGKSFVLTGKFAMGPRKACEALIVSHGGVCKRSVIATLDYLVIGSFGSRDWIQTSHGRKIEKAMQLKKDGRQVAIVGECHWATELERLCSS